MATKISDLHKEWSKDAEYSNAYEALSPQYELAQRLIEARNIAGLSQADVAKRMGTKQSAISRIESGQNLSVDKLRQYADALGRKVSIELA